MAALTGNQIDQSYQGLIKTTDNAGLSGTAKAITDGVGGATNIEMSNTATNFVSGTVDFTGSTVSGLPGGAGLESGTGTDSMQSASSLTTVAANAAQEDSIAIGDGAEVTGAGNGGIAIGQNATVNAPTLGGVCIGLGGSSAGDYATAIGNNADATGVSSFAAGLNAAASGKAAIVIGQSTAASQEDAIAFGRVSSVTGNGAIGIGRSTQATATNAVALGRDVVASTADTVTVNMLQIQNYANIDFVDDADAAAGGIPLGGVYANSGELRIRIA